MDFAEKRESSALVLRALEARLDASNAPDLRVALATHIAAGEQQIVLDLQNVEFMDSSALGALINAVKQMGPLGTISIANVGSAVNRLLTLTRMDKVFPVSKTVEEALEKLAR